MKILQCPLEIAGQAALTADGLNLVGQESRTLLMPHPFSPRNPASLPLRGNGWRTRQVERVLWTPYAIGHFDVIHYHNGTSLIPFGNYSDARLARRLGTRVVVEFWGADCRLPSVEAARNPWYIPSPNDDDGRNRDRMGRWSEVTGGHVVVADHFADHFIDEYFDHIHVVGQRVDIGHHQFVPPESDCAEPVVLHAPSNQAVKGTAEVRGAVEALRVKGRKFRYVELSGVPASEVASAIGAADLVVDQLRLGAHGVFSAEAMAAGKPVICHISEEMAAKYPSDLPIIDADPSSIEAVLDRWIADGPGRREAGIDGRAYAERVHDHRTVARKLVDVYGQLPRTASSGPSHAGSAGGVV